MTTKLKGLLSLILTLGACLSTAFAQAPPVYAPAHPHQDPAFYVFGPDGAAHYGAEDNLQVTFVKVPANSGSVTLYVWDPGSGGSHEPASNMGDNTITTDFTIYGGTGAFTASQTNRPTPDQAGTVLDKLTIGKKKKSDRWATFGPYDLSAGETVGDSTYFKIVALGTSGSGGNFFKIGSSHPDSEIFAYDVTMHLAKDKREHTTIWVELPEGTTTLVEENYDLDEGGIPYFDGERLQAASSGNWVTNRISVTPHGQVVRVPYDIDRTGRQDYSNGGFHFADGNGMPLRMFFRPADALPPPPAPVPNNVCDIHTDLVHLRQEMPAEATLNSEFTYTITVTGKAEAANVVVYDRLPSNARFVGTDPQITARNEKGELVWEIGDLNAGESRTLAVTVVPTEVGVIESCAIVKADPKCCVSTPVGQPKLKIVKNGPAKALNGDDVTYNITVTNTGTAPAKDVSVVDSIPVGFDHPSGRTHTFPTIPVLAVGESRSYTITMTANVAKANLPTTLCNVVTTTAPNVVKDADDTAEACTLIEHYDVAIAKTGPPREIILRTASYNITVTNSGSSTLTNLVVTDTLPAGAILKDAGGGTVSGSTISWTIDSLAKGQSKSFTVALTMDRITPAACNRVGVTTAEGPTANAEACTEWIGKPALLIEVIDSKDPVRAGEETMFVIQVTNQGTADDNAIKVTAQFNTALLTPEVSRIQGSTPVASANGGIIVFKETGILAPKRAVEWRIPASAKAGVTGDHRIKVLMESDAIKPPVPEEESTQVY